jgi:hypothetical protein
MCLRVTFRDGRIAAIFEYDGERAHQEVVERFGFAAEAGA